jgi:translation initiation factor 1 (eIF-1/SUI1)
MRRSSAATTTRAFLFYYSEKPVSKAFASKFNLYRYTSVTKDASGKGEIDVQGDFSEEMAKIITDKFGIDADLIKLVDKGK